METRFKQIVSITYRVDGGFYVERIYCKESIEAHTALAIARRLHVQHFYCGQVTIGGVALPLEKSNGYHLYFMKYMQSLTGEKKESSYYFGEWPRTKREIPRLILDTL